jgi:hypothetical protein
MKEGKFKLKYKISDNVHTYNSVTTSLCYAGFKQTEGTAWNVLWSAPLKAENLREFDSYKHCNHFAGTWNLGHKALMYRNVSAYQREFGEEFNIAPKTWILPHDYGTLQNERQNAKSHKLWILKPSNYACGKGIRVINSKSRLPKNGSWVVSKYLMKPHLI